jgi:DNA-binding cell septation regulator SpoVG
MTIKCIEFKEYNQGSVRGFPTLELQQVGMTIRGISLMEGEDGKRWLAMPSRRYQDREGATKYDPYIRFTDNAYAAFQKAALKAIDDFLKAQNPEPPVPDDDIPF